MNVGWIGLGKLGLPCALTMADVGHTVIGTDANPDVKGYLANRKIPYQEAGVAELWDNGARIGWRDNIAQVVDEADIVFVAVQTPHAPAYEGVTPLPSTTRDFEYGYLETAVKDIVRHARRELTVVIVSTVLPGTTRRVVLPHTAKNPFLRVVYSPAFIAMGTASADWKGPAMVLAGTEDVRAYSDLLRAHSAMHTAPIIKMAIESAELTKVLYNTFIGMKIVFANTAMEIAHKTGADCDEVSRALAQATDRIISPAYLRGGMGDGGGCHPRDNIALSHLADHLNLSVDPFRWLMEARESQTRWLAKLAKDWKDVTGLSIYICGQEYKKNTNLTVGSPSRLLHHILRREFEVMPIWCTQPTSKGIFIIGTNHDQYAKWTWPEGSVVLDPWGYIPDQTGVVVVRIGRK